MAKFVISCDWFAYSCSSRWGVATDNFREVLNAKHAPSGGLLRVVKDASGERAIPARVGQVFVSGSSEYRIVESTEFNALFFCSVLIQRAYFDDDDDGKLQKRWQDIAVLSYGHRREHNSLKCIAKVVNSLLYSSGWADVFMHCLAAIGWRPVRVARVDICADFKEFAHHRSPSLFISDYLRNPTSSRCSYIRRGSNRYRVAGERFVHANSVESITWGTRDSPVRVVMYNKSKELRDKHSKPWIIAKWEANGLCCADDVGKVNDVWRVEISINPTAVALATADKSQVLDFSLSQFASSGALLEMWETLVPRYFQFYALSSEDSAANRSVRDLPAVELFEMSGASSLQPFTISRKASTGKIEKMLAKRLRTQIATYANSEQQALAIEEVSRLLLDISYDKELQDFVTTESVLSEFIHGIRMPKQHPIGCVTRDWSRRQAARWAKILEGARPAGYEAFDDALQLLQSDVSVVQRLCRQSYKSLPDEAAEAISESYL